MLQAGQVDSFGCGTVDYVSCFVCPGVSACVVSVFLFLQPLLQICPVAEYPGLHVDAVFDTCVLPSSILPQNAVDDVTQTQDLAVRHK